MTDSPLAERIVGCIVGGAVGDALGGPYEGSTGPVKYEPPKAWQISDDTQLTLATCEAIAASHRVDPQDIADRFLEWFRTRRITGIGGSTLKALRDLEVGAHWALSGARGDRAAGNGAAMRAAPLAFVLNTDRHDGRTTLRDVCRITHHNDEAYVGALAIVVAIRQVALVHEAPNDNLPAVVAGKLPDSRVRDRLLVLADARPTNSLMACAQHYGTSGYVVDSVPLAIMAASELGRIGFAELLKSAVECGGDTDTVASMAGQIAGAAVGYTAIPREFVTSLPDLATILAIAQAFADFVGSP